MTTAPINRLKARLKAGETTRGIWLNLGADSVTEMAGNSGADWCLIDGEHAPYNPADMLRSLRIMEGTPAEAVVRVPCHEDWVLKQVLDLGAQNIIVPMVETPDQAQAIVEACRYPPAGKRGVGPAVARSGGYGRFPDYKETADDQICLILQAEAGRALDNIEAIAAVDGVDGIFIGPSDLAADLNTDAASVAAAIDDAIARIAATGVAAGILTNIDMASHYEALGARFTAVASDARLMHFALKGVFG